MACSTVFHFLQNSMSWCILVVLWLILVMCTVWYVFWYYTWVLVELNFLIQADVRIDIGLRNNNTKEAFPNWGRQTRGSHDDIYMTTTGHLHDGNFSEKCFGQLKEKEFNMFIVVFKMVSLWICRWTPLKKTTISEKCVMNQPVFKQVLYKYFEWFNRTLINFKIWR